MSCLTIVSHPSPTTFWLSEWAGAGRPWDRPIQKGKPMLYAILAYHVETEVMSWTKAEEAAVMAGLSEAHARISQRNRLGPAARLGTTQKALTLRGPGAGIVLDGPFAETKEQLLGFYIIDVESEDKAIAAARELRAANPKATYELRPIALFLPGQSIPRTEDDSGLMRLG
jgi:hypothetical protein